MITRAYVFFGFVTIFCFCMLTDRAKAVNTTCYNVAQIKGNGQSNAQWYNQVQKNFMIFQMGGWSGLTYDQVHEPTWPLHWGQSGYFNRNNDVYQWQMAEVAAVNYNMAPIFLIMPDEEAAACGYGCYFDGVWKNPRQLYPNAAWAAWYNGLMWGPFFSINLIDDPGHGERVLGRLQTLTNWWRANPSLMQLRNTDGKLIICTEGLPQNLNMTVEQRHALQDWMTAQTDIVWIDNLAFVQEEVARAGSNVCRSAATNDPYGGIQDWLKNIWGDKYRWHYLHRYGEKISQIVWTDPTVGNKWLNISPPMSCPWPVLFSQWNEYGESLTFEPTELDQYDEWYFLLNILQGQP